MPSQPEFIQSQMDASANCTRPLIVGFRGLIGAGKTAVCTKLANDFFQMLDAPDVWFLHMAGPLKRGLEIMGIGKDGNLDLYREAAQWLGTDLVRKKYPNHWVNLFLKEVHAISRTKVSKPSIILVDDIRFLNEAKVCDFLIYLDRGNKVYSTHESEAWNLGFHKSRTTLCNQRTMLVDNNRPLEETVAECAKLIADKYNRMYRELCETDPVSIRG